MAIIHQVQRREPIRNSDSLARLRAMATERPIESAVAVERAASRIAIEMARMHGGDWQVRIDHQRRSVLVWALD